MTKPKSKSKSKPSSSSTPTDATQMAVETTKIRYKAPHNYVGILTKPTTDNTFDSIIDILSASKYKTLITADAPIYLQTQREFWKNATLEKQGDIITAINSSIQGKKVQISPQSISEIFKLDDLKGKTSFSKDELKKDFINRGYAEQPKRDTLQKGYFPSAPRFLFHTLLMCVSNKTTSFNEIPTKIQCLGYAILNNENYNYSQEIFDDLVKNIDNKAFLLFPRFLSYYFEQKYVKKEADLPKQGASFKINCLTPETFSRMLAPIKTKAEVPEQNLADETAPQVSAAEPTAPGDQSSTPTVLKPTPATTKRTKKKISRKPTKPKSKASLEDEIPETMPVTAQKSQITTAVTSSQQLEERSQPQPQTPPASSQKDQVVNTGTPQYEALDPLGSIFHSPDPKDMSLSTPLPSPHIIPPSTIPLLHAADVTQTQTSFSQPPITESILQQVTGSDVDISAIPATN
ncbi:hypothetical protein HanIR_Chr04g0173811 [Helianthus annuus]|nr:hypothetical protein HanIR_Chr04g0173811 [Helianthus annuus]